MEKVVHVDVKLISETYNFLTKRHIIWQKNYFTKGVT